MSDENRFLIEENSSLRAQLAEVTAERDEFKRDGQDFKIALLAVTERAERAEHLAQHARDSERRERAMAAEHMAAYARQAERERIEAAPSWPGGRTAAEQADIEDGRA